MNLSQKKNGFTLVELSIVLIIIGLLIGGILIAQSMISTARLHSLYTQAQQYDTAVNLFQERYKYLPGDYPYDGFPVNPGNGDGKILAADEGIQAWYELVLGINVDFKCQYYCDTSYNGAIPNINVPPLSWDKSVGFSLGLSLPAGANAFLIGRQSGNLAFTAGGFLSPAEVLSIDQKYDDGVPNTGNVRTHTLGVCVDSLDTTKYYLANTDKACSIDLFLTEYGNK